MGRYVLGPAVFAALRQTAPDRSGEVQLADALRLVLAGGGRVLAVPLGANERRHDIGNVERYCAASIPRGVGLGGSSAIVIATLRALVELHSVVLPESELAAMALAVEAEDLGIIVRRSVAQLARFAHDARAALLDEDQRAFARCVDGSFDARRQMMTLEQAGCGTIRVVGPA